MKKILYIALATFISVQLNAAIKTQKSVNDSCFTPIFATGNLVADPGVTNLTNFPGSWGTAAITQVPTEVYCGASCGIIPASGTGSFTFPVSWKPNTKYVVRAMIKTVGVFQIGLSNTYINNVTANIEYLQYTNSLWTLFEKRFTTGSSGKSGEFYFNNYNATGTVGYIDNIEIYEDIDIATSETNLSFDKTVNTLKFLVSGTQLNKDITIEAPNGITVTPSTLPANSDKAIVEVKYDGATVVDGNIVLTSDTYQKQVKVKSASTGSTFKQSTDFTNLIPDPNLNSLTNFKITGTCNLISLFSGSVTPYTGVSCIQVGNGTNTCSGTLEFANINWKPNTVYRIVAMVKSNGTFTVGFSNVEGSGTNKDYNLPYTGTVWDSKDITFITGPNAVKGSCYFNNCGTSTQLYIDNWEIYEIPTDLCGSAN